GSAYVTPAVLTGVTSDMDAYREELFGPVATVYKVTSDDEALALANDSRFGLGGAGFAEDPERAAKPAQRLEVGMSNADTPPGVAAAPVRPQPAASPAPRVEVGLSAATPPAGEGAAIPFGGTKRSGFGRELGPYGMDAFVNKRMYYVAD